MKYLTTSKIDIFTDKKIYEKNYENFLNLDNISYHFEIDDKILSSADCIMTDVFNSMNDKDDKEALLKRFMVDQELMNKTSGNAVFMHCLPAKIGSEVSNDVIKGPKSIVLKQAKNRMVVQRGIMKWLEL